MTHPDRENTLALLADWQERHVAIQRMFDGIASSMGLDPNGTLFATVWDLFDAYTAAITTFCADEECWAIWFMHDNDMGRKGMEAGYDGNLKAIRTTADLYELISESRKRRAQGQTP